jgi:hypothetical protein
MENASKVRCVVALASDDGMVGGQKNINEAVSTIVRIFTRQTDEVTMTLKVANKKI